MDNNTRQHKIDYLMSHTTALQKGMMNKIDDTKTLLYGVKEALISEQPLESCPTYSSLEQYFKDEKEQTINEKQAGFELIGILSNMVNIMNRVQEPDQIARIVSYYSYIGANQQSQQDHPQKRISYSA